RSLFRSDADIDLSVANAELRLAQPEFCAALVVAGPDAELVAVPGTDDLALGLIIGLRAHGLVGGRGLQHALHNAALADRAGAVGAAVVPAKEFVADAKHADFELAAFHHLAIAVSVIGDLARHVFRHRRLPVFPTARPAPPFTGRPGRSSILSLERAIHHGYRRAGHFGGGMTARPLMPAISSGASPRISPNTLMVWLTGSTRPPTRVISAE